MLLELETNNGSRRQCMQGGREGCMVAPSSTETVGKTELKSNQFSKQVG